MPRVGFEPTISAGEWPKTYALDRAATGTGSSLSIVFSILCSDLVIDRILGYLLTPFFRTHECDHHILTFPSHVSYAYWFVAHSQ